MNRKQIAVTLLVGAGLMAFSFVYGRASAATNDPGSDADPLVSKSYVDQVVAGLAQKTDVDQAISGLTPKSYVDAQVAGLQTKIDQLSVTNDKGNAAFGVVLLPKGAQLIGESGTEIVLRAGQATAIVSAKGGVLDATAGVDLVQDATIAKNHLLVIPVTDGRGLAAKQDSILIVKGPFRVQPAGQ